MKLRITTSCAGLDFSFSAGQEVEVEATLGADLVRGGHAVEVENDPETAAEPAPEGLETPEKPARKPKK